MLKKILLSVFAVVVAVPAAGVGYLYMRKPAQRPAPPIRVAVTPERIARGRYIFTLADCGGCHSQRDFTRVAGPDVESGEGRGNVLSEFLHDLPGIVVAPNITPDPETGIGTWTDGEKIRAIREGVDREGRALFPMMPYAVFRNMSDDDVQALVAYLNSLRPVKNPLPKSAIKFPVSLLIKSAPQPVERVPEPDMSTPVKRGKYLVSVAGCADCHTPAEKGQSVPGKTYAGGQVFASQMGTVVAANITPDVQTGIGRWTEDDFLKKFDDYKDYAAGGAPKVAGPESFTVMPWLHLCRLPPEDLRAIYQYLRTVKPVHNSVETHPGAPKKVAAR